MAKHFYHIPLQKTLSFIKTHKSTLRTLATDKRRLDYQKQLGKSYYMLEIEIFIDFFKIDKDLDYALKTIEYFNARVFMTEIDKILNFSQFELLTKNIDTKEFFYAFCYLYAKEDTEDFSLFIQKTFLHYHTAFNSNSNIHIDFQELSQTLAKSKNITIKESFGEEKENAFFRIWIEDKIEIEEQGKRIKTLRKKAYKRLFYYLM